MGTKCPERLNGMFVFALYDTEQQILFLARDRAGEKPLYYHYANGTLRFASELKGLLADPTLPRRINPESLDCYLLMGFVPGERCILQDLINCHLRTPFVLIYRAVKLKCGAIGHCQSWIPPLRCTGSIELLWSMNWKYC